MDCKICNSKTIPVFSADILAGKYNVVYYSCSRCGFLQTEEPYWLNEAYKSAINRTDTGIVKRNILLSRVVSSLLYFYFNKQGKMLDYAGGHGLFTRMMRDIGFDFYWSDKYADNIFARGFEYSSADRIDLITAFEVFEHLVNPLDEIDKMITITDNILFSTTLLPQPLPKPEDWWYYGLDHGQHVSLYSKKTLLFIAQKYRLNLCSDKDLHLFTSKKISDKTFKWVVKLTYTGVFSFLHFLIKSKTEDDYKILITRQ